VLRRQSLLGDAMSHAALPGVVIAFMLTGSKAPLVLIVGAALAGWLGTLCLIAIVRYTRIKEDSALGLILVRLFRPGPDAAHLFAAQPRRPPGRSQQLSSLARRPPCWSET
jgi:hypothetical protein